jgi:hypothetical protein
MTDVPGGNQLPTPGNIDSRTGIKPEELALLKGLTEVQRAAIVQEIGGTWPEKRDSEITVDASPNTAGVGDIALDGAVTPYSTETSEESTEAVLSPEEKRGVEAIVNSPKILAGIDFSGRGHNGRDFGYGQDWMDYKYLRVAGQDISRQTTRDKAQLIKESGASEDVITHFESMLLFREHDLKELDQEKFKRVFFGTGASYLAKIEAESGITTYVLSFVAPKAGNRDRSTVRLILTIPPDASLEDDQSMIDNNPGLILDVFRGLSGDIRVSSWQTLMPLRDLADDVEPPMVLSEEEARTVRDKNIGQHQRKQAEADRRKQELETRLTPPPKTRRWGRRDR